MSKRSYSHWVLEAFANNEIRFTRRSSSPSPRKGGDKAEQKRLEAESKRLNQIIELGHELRRYQGQTFIEVPLLPYRSHVGIIKPLELTKSPTGVDLGVYRRSDIETFRECLISEDRAIRLGNPPPLDIPSEFQEVTLLGKITHSAKVSAAIKFRDLACEFLAIKPRKKSPTLSRYARHTILEAGAVIERNWGNHAVFCTMTIPGSTRDALKTVAENSSWLMNRLYQRVRDLCKKLGIEIGWFYSWELQKRGALHPHICLSAKPSEMSKRQLLTLGQELESYWFDLLFELLDKTGVDVFERNARYGLKTWRYSPHKWQSRVEMVTKSVAAYLSKYASKGAANEHQKAIDGLEAKGVQIFLPSRWWGCSRNIHQLIKSWRFKYTFPIAWMDDPEIVDLIYSIIEGKYLSPPVDINTNLSTIGLESDCLTLYDNILERSLGYRFDVIRNNRSVIHGETEIYWYNPAIFAEIHGQIKALCESEFIAIPSDKFSSPKRVTSHSVLSRIIDSQHERRTQQEIKITGVEPGTGMIVDFEQFICHRDWQSMQDPWYCNETFRMADEEIEWSAKVLSIWFNQLRDMNKQNEYDYQFGNQSPISRIGDWQMIEALSNSHELEKNYRDGLIG